MSSNTDETTLFFMIYDLRDGSRTFGTYKMDIFVNSNNLQPFVTERSILNAAGDLNPQMPKPRRVEENTYIVNNRE